MEAGLGGLTCKENSSDGRVLCARAVESEGGNREMEPHLPGAVQERRRLLGGGRRAWHGDQPAEAR